MRQSRSVKPGWALGVVGAGLVAASVAWAAGGTLDPTFDGDGVARLSLGSGSLQHAVVQSDGKILVSGTYAPGAPGNCAVVARYLPTGALDATFGSGGVAYVPGTDAGGAQLAVQSDGRILVTGRSRLTTTVTSGSGKKQTTTTTSVEAAAVARLNADGTPDTTFGTNGVATVVPAQSAYAFFTSLVVRADGRTVASGFADQPGARRGDARQYAILLAQFLPGGGLDTSFGSAGVVLEDLTTSDDSVHPRSLVLQADGGLLVGCTVGTVAAALRRYGSGGAPDTAFGTHPVSGMAYLAALAADAQGRLLVAGRGPNGGTADVALLVRLLPDGTPDGSFGSGGTVGVLPPGAASSQAYLPAIAADGSLLVPGDVTPATGHRTALVFRLTPAGALDATFGTGGFSPALDLGAQVTQGYACAADASDSPILVGYAASSTGNNDGFVARFLGN